MTEPPASALPRLLAGTDEHAMSDLSAHVAVHGPLPGATSGPELMELVERAGLRGRGGAAFPTAVKLRAVAARRGRRVVVANATEGEPLSKKDRTLLRVAPHLAIDGTQIAARAIGARRCIIAISETDARGRAAIERALTQRAGQDPISCQIVVTPDRFLAGQESALVNLLNGGPGLPTFGPRPFERGVQGAPTLVQNVETFAHLALIARHGSDWFRGLGPANDPGSALTTVAGAVSTPGVYEIEHGMAVSELLALAGADAPAAILVGGYFGTWLAPEAASDTRLSGAGRTGVLGAGVVFALPRSACPVAETARVAEYFAAQSAGQCGPCVHGLAAIAHTVTDVAAGVASPSELADLHRWCGDLPGRGACRHPDGAVRLLASALRVFADDFADHVRHGRCPRCLHPPVLPVPPLPVVPAPTGAAGAPARSRRDDRPGRRRRTGPALSSGGRGRTRRSRPPSAARRPFRP